MPTRCGPATTSSWRTGNLSSAGSTTADGAIPPWSQAVVLRRAPSSATARPTRTGTPSARARSTSTSATVDLPMPASPVSSTTDPLPARAAASNSPNSARTRSRPTTADFTPIILPGHVPRLGGWLPSRSRAGSTGTLRLVNQVEAGTVADLPVDRRREHSVSDATRPDTDPLHVVLGFSQREADRDLKDVAAARAEDRFDLVLFPVVCAVGDERRIPTRDACSARAVVAQRIDHEPERASAAGDADGLGYVVHGVALGRILAQILGDVCEVVASPPLATGIDHGCLPCHETILHRRRSRARQVRPSSRPALPMCGCMDGRGSVGV